MFGAVASAAVPDLNGGTWQVENPPVALKTLAGHEPPLLPAAKALYAKNLAAIKAGDLAADPTALCLSPGVPRVMLMPAPQNTFEFLQRPQQIVILYAWNRIMRFVDMNVPQREIVAPAYVGQSVGKWQGGTLVVDSIGFADNSWLDSSGLPHSDALHVTERYTPAADGQTMTLHILIDDPKDYAKPWETVLNLRHDPAGRISEDECVERKHLKWGKFTDAP